jgi:hypothetical protein
MRSWGHTVGWFCAVVLVSLLPLACSQGAAKPADEKSTLPGWHEVRLLKRTGVIEDYRPVRPQKPVEYPTEYEINGGDAHVRFAKRGNSDGPDLEIEGASDEFADKILAALRSRSFADSR